MKGRTDDRAGLCQRGRTCPRTADVEQTFGRGPRARVRRFCEPCAADARVIFGSDITAERPLENPEVKP